MAQDIKKYLDMAAWEKLQNSISKKLGISIRTIDTQGNEIISSGNIPFYCTIIRSKNKGKMSCKEELKFNLEKTSEQNKEHIEFECCHGLMNMLFPITIHNRKIGGIVFSYKKEKENEFFERLSKKLSISKEELSEEYSKIQTYSERDINIFKNIISSITETIPEIIYHSHMNNKKTSALRTIKKISSVVNSTLEIKKIMTEIIRFIVENNFAKTCSVVTLSPMRRYTLNENSLPKHYTNFENNIANEVIKSRKIRGVENISKDKRFNSRSNFNIYDALISIPITNQFEVLGVLNMYSESGDKLKQNIELFSIIADQAGIAIANAKQYEQMKHSADTDKLTGLYNRRYFMDVLEQETARSRRFGHPISVAMIDIDHFKQYNDNNGHPKGDKLLKELASLLKECVRDVDTVGRYGGEEFIIVFPEIKPNEILSAADRIVKSVANNKFDSGEKQPGGKITISMGLLTCMDVGMDAKDIIKEADNALYDAKNDGRNKVQAKVLLKKGMKAIDVN